MSKQELDASVLVRMPVELKARFDAQIPFRKRGPLMRQLAERYLDDLDREQLPLDVPA